MNATDLNSNSEKVVIIWKNMYCFIQTKQRYMSFLVFYPEHHISGKEFSGNTKLLDVNF